jgi:hypothetical protein
MALLRFHELDPKRAGGTRVLSTILGVGALVGSIALGTTLAANISLNGGSTVEFGQGIAQTTSCDDNVLVTPQASFINDAENAAFLFNTFSVTDISENCFGKTFTIKAYTNGQNSPLDFYDTNGEIFTEIKVANNNGVFGFVGGGLTSDDIQTIGDGFYVTIGAGTLPSFSLISGEDLDRLTIESSDSISVGGDGSQLNPGFSASQIKSDYPDTLSGWYWITNANIQSGTPFQIYADMSDPDGPWTLVFANGHESSWTPSQLRRNQSLDLTPPTITDNLAADGVKYSILEWADFLKKSVGTSQLEIRITAPASPLSGSGDFSGVWRAPFNTSFIGTTASVALSRVNVSGGSVRDVMPYLTTNGINNDKDSLTMCSGNCWWDTLAASSSYGGGMPFDTPRMTIMYWVRS